MYALKSLAKYLVLILMLAAAACYAPLEPDMPDCPYSNLPDGSCAPSWW